MTGKELLEAYPKAAETVVKFYSDQFIKSIEAGDVSDEIKEYAKGQTIDLEYIATFMDINPRGLFDVFDANNIYIVIDSIFAERPVYFIYEVMYNNDGSRVSDDIEYSTRIEAEKAAIEVSFEILNEKL